MRQFIFLCLALLMLGGCTAERLPGDGSTVQLNAMPPGMETFDSLLIHEDSEQDISDHDEAQRDAIAQRWTELLRESPYVHLVDTTERAVIRTRSVFLAEPRITRRSVVRAEMYMGHESVWTAGWVCDADGTFDPERPEMKLWYEGGPVIERAKRSDDYFTYVRAADHPWGTNSMRAMDYWHGCMIGSSSQTWLGESWLHDFFIKRLAESKLLPGTREFNGVPCHVIRWSHRSMDHENGEIFAELRHDYYFNQDGAYVGRDAQQWSDGTLIIERSVHEMTIFDSMPDELSAFRSWLAEGLDEDKLAARIAEAPFAGNRAPDVTLTMLDGSKRSLSELLETGPVVIDFWATWCAPCRASLPRVAAAARELKDENVQVIAVAVHDRESSVRKYLREQELDIVAAVDASHEISTGFEVSSVPWLVVIDTDGIIRVSEPGIPDDVVQAIRRALEHDAGEFVSR